MIKVRDLSLQYIKQGICKYGIRKSDLDFLKINVIKQNKSNFISEKDVEKLQNWFSKPAVERHKILYAETCLDKYGDSYFKDHAAKGRETKKQRYGDNFDKIFMQKAKDRGSKKSKINEYNFTETKKINYPTTKTEFIIPEPITDDQLSLSNTSILNFIKSKYSGEILENYESLSIYIPEFNFAIDIDNHLQYSEALIFKYHEDVQVNVLSKNLSLKALNKTIQCEKQGIRLLHILDLQWNDPKKQEILKSMISSALGIYQKKYFARKLTFKEIDSITGRKVLNENHIQGAGSATKYFALLDNENNPIQVMSFQLHSNHKHDECELNRMVTLKNTQVVGGFSKLLKNSLKSMQIVFCTSYIDRGMFDGKGYKAAGFKKISETGPAYFYIFDNEIKRREFGMRYHIEKMFKEGKIDYWNPNETERVNMIKNKIPRIWDCGKIKVEYSLDNHL